MINVNSNHNASNITNTIHDGNNNNAFTDGTPME